MLTLFLRLLRDRQWWLGSLVAAVGFALQAAALGLGSVLLVQALLVTSLLFALPISARLSHRRVTRWEWTWAALLAAAVAVIVTVGNPTAGHSRASLETWTAVIARARACAGAVRDRRQRLERARSARCCWPWCPARCGAFRGADQGRGGPPRRRHRRTAAHTRAVRVGAGGRRRHRDGNSSPSGRER